jgi:hypothetical protein
MKFKLNHNKDFMNAFKKFAKLTSSIEIIVPSTIDVNQNFDTTEWINKTMDFLIIKFGGATSYNAIGGWQSSSGFSVKENITSVVSYTDNQKLESESYEVVEFCESMKQALKQEAIFVKINGEVIFI